MIREEILCPDFITQYWYTSMGGLVMLSPNPTALGSDSSSQYKWLISLNKGERHITQLPNNVRPRCPCPSSDQRAKLQIVDSLHGVNCCNSILQIQQHLRESLNVEAQALVPGQTDYRILTYLQNGLLNPQGEGGLLGGNDDNSYPRWADSSNQRTARQGNRYTLDRSDSFGCVIDRQQCPSRTFFVLVHQIFRSHVNIHWSWMRVCIWQMKVVAEEHCTRATKSAGMPPDISNHFQVIKVMD